jgi:putative serine protease PepD
MPESAPLWSGDETEARPAASPSVELPPDPAPTVPEPEPFAPPATAREHLSRQLKANDSPPGGSPGGPPRSRSAAGVFVAVFCTLLLLGAAVVVAATLLSNRNAGQTAPAIKPLAAVPGDVGRSRVGEVYRLAAGSVVQIRTTTGSGTGFLIDRDGTFVTNAHVIGGAQSVRLRLDGVARLIAGKVIGTDESSDLAVIDVNPSEIKGLRPLPLADSDRVNVGDLAVAIGYPLGLDRTATAGIVSGTGRRIEAPNGFSIDKVIQTDAPINPGNSGGPLLDARGRVIGINSQIATAGSQGNLGIGFAVPSNTVRDVVPILRSGRAVIRPYLGVSTGETRTGTLGAVVRGVTSGGPAAGAGLRPATRVDGSDGDVILSVAGKRITGPDDISTAIEGRKPGETVAIEVQRGQTRKTLQVKLGRRPEGAGP